MYSKDLRDRLGSVDRVREILFGSQLRTYEQRFGQLESELKLLQQDFQEELGELEITFEKDLKEALAGVDEQLRGVQGQRQSSLEELRSQTDRASVQLQNVLSTVDESLERRTKELDRQLLELRDSLQGNVRELRQELFNALERHLATLTSFKMNRNDMADLLFQASMQARDEDLVPKLEAVGQEMATEDLSDLENLLSQ